VGSPLWQRQVVWGALDAIGFDGGWQQQRVDRNGKGRLSWHRELVTDLGLADSEGGLVLAMVDLDLPDQPADH